MLNRVKACKTRFYFDLGNVNVFFNVSSSIQFSTSAQVPKEMEDLHKKKEEFSSKWGYAGHEQGGNILNIFFPNEQNQPMKILIKLE